MVINRGDTKGDKMRKITVEIIFDGWYKEEITQIPHGDEMEEMIFYQLDGDLGGFIVTDVRLVKEENVN